MNYRFASLTPADEPAIALHLMSLDVEDRALRFGSPVTDDILGVYAQGLNFNRDVAEGAWDGGRLVGLAHLAVFPEGGYPVGELGLSIAPGYRRQGISSLLIKHAIARARRFRLTRMYVHYMRRNLAMTRLVRHFGLDVEYYGDEARASLEVVPRAQSVWTETRRAGPGGRLEVFHRASVRPLRGHVLLVHGAGGDGWQWRSVMAELAAAGYSAHALSLSGHGRSARAAPTLERMRTDVAEILAELPGDTRLVGHSMGGYLVQRELMERECPAAVLLAPVPPDVPRGQDLDALLAGLSGRQARMVAASILAEAPGVAVERVSTPVALISGDRDRVMPVPWMRATAARYRAQWTRLPAGHNLPVVTGVGRAVVSGLLS